MTPLHCPECGAAVAGGLIACRQLFDEVLAREFGDYRYARQHRLMVDAYSLQHPDDFMRSPKSYAAHLTGALVALEAADDARAAETNRAIQQWLGGPKALPRPGQPEAGQRGTLTILHVHAATSPEDHVRRVREWADAAWEAWRDYRPIAKQWIDEALATRRPV